MMRDFNGLGGKVGGDLIGQWRCALMAYWHRHQKSVILEQPYSFFRSFPARWSISVSDDVQNILKDVTMMTRVQFP